MTAPVLRQPLPAGMTPNERTPRPMADDGRTYIRVHDGMPDHPKVDALSDRAFRLLVETWCWCSRHLTDGHVPKSTWSRRGSAKARRELVDAGLVEDLGEKGVQMHDYLQHQRSRSEVAEVTAARRAAALKANHSRWHTGPKGRLDPTCALCGASKSDPSSDPKSDPQRTGERSPDGYRGVIHIGIGTDRGIGTAVPEETSGGGVPDSSGRDETAPTPSRSASERPADRCARHAGLDGDPGPCRACGDARRDAESWDATTAHAAAQAQRGCRWCDADGWRIDPDNRHRGPMGVRCDHTPLAQHLAEASR